MKVYGRTPPLEYKSAITLKDNFARKTFYAPLEAHFALHLLSDHPLDNVCAKAFAHKADIPDLRNRAKRGCRLHFARC